MHEFALMTSVMQTVESVAREHKARRVTAITLTVGDMVEAVEESLRFAFEALSADTVAQGAHLIVNTVTPESTCAECQAVFEHDRLHVRCPECGSRFTALNKGKELAISAIELDLPDNEEA